MFKVHAILFTIGVFCGQRGPFLRNKVRLTYEGVAGCEPFRLATICLSIAGQRLVYGGTLMKRSRRDALLDARVIQVVGITSGRGMNCLLSGVGEVSGSPYNRGVPWTVCFVFRFAYGRFCFSLFRAWSIWQPPPVFVVSPSFDGSFGTL